MHFVSLIMKCLKNIAKITLKQYKYTINNVLAKSIKLIYLEPLNDLEQILKCFMIL
jgi:hypothetical protein